jgi:hypothetical protein
MKTMTKYKLSLLATFILFAFSFSSAYAEWDHTQVLGYKKCAKCHESEVDQWKETQHNLSYKKIHKSDKAKSIVNEMGQKKMKDPEGVCARCHYTVGTKKKKPKVVSGVGCESCHGPAKDWLKPHRPKGKGISRDNETDKARIARHSHVKGLGMIIPSDTYGFANNCMSCHLTPNEKLVNATEHPAGSDFQFLQRLDKVRHGPKPDNNQENLIKVMGYAVELEHSLRALENASEDGKFRAGMLQRVYTSLANLKAINKASPTQELSTLFEALPSAFNPNDKASIKQAYVKVKETATDLSSRGAGNLFKGISQLVHIDKADVPKTAASSKQPVSKPVIKKTTAASKPAKIKPVSKPNKVTSTSSLPAPAPVQVNVPATAVKTVQKTPAPISIPEPISTSIPKPVEPPMIPAKEPPLPAIKPETKLPTEQKVDSKQVTTSKQSKLIKGFSIYSPKSQTLCNTDQPWLLGKLTVDNITKLASQSCFGAEINFVRGSDVFLMSQSPGSAPTVLFPDACQAFGPIINDETIYLPNQNGELGALRLDKGAGIETFYLVVSNNKETSNTITNFFSGFQTACGEQPLQPATVGIQEFIDTKASQLPGVDWLIKSFKHN